MQLWHASTHNHLYGNLYLASKEQAEAYLDVLGNQCYTSQAVAANWPPTIVYNLPPKDFNKVIFASREFLVVSEKGKQALTPMLGSAAEFLPLIHNLKDHKSLPHIKALLKNDAYEPFIKLFPTQPHFLLNILDIRSLEILDMEQSELEYQAETNTVDLVDKLVFKEAALKGAHLFKIMEHGPYLSRLIFISEELKATIEQNQLTGLDFILHPRQGNLIWGSIEHSFEELTFDLFTEYIRIEAQNFIDFFSTQSDNQEIRAFSLAYEGGDRLDIGFIDKASYQDDNGNMKQVYSWPFTPGDYDGFRQYYHLVEDFLEDFLDSKSELLEAGESELVHQLEEKLRHSISQALKQLDFTHIRTDNNFELFAQSSVLAF